MPDIVTPPPVAAPPAKPKFNFPLPTVAIIGQSGTGKTTSYQNMPWEETLVIDTERKGFPFDAKNKFINYIEATSPMAVEQAISKVKSNPGQIKYIILDSLYKYMEMQILECKSAFKNYDIYNNYTARMRDFIKSLKNPNIIFIMIGVDELVTLTDDGGKATNLRRIATFGKELEAKWELEFLVVLYTAVKKKAGAEGMDYLFLTNTDGIASAKSPAGMLPAQYIPNDLATVVKAIRKTL